MKIGVTCPLYINNWNHRDYLDQTTRSITSAHEWVWLPVANHIAPQFLPYAWQFVQHPTATQLIEGRRPQAVAKAWNDGIATGITLGCDYILVINEDIVLKGNAIDNLVSFAQRHPEATLWSMGAYHDLFSLEQAKDEPTDYHEHPNFSAFMVRRDFPETFGRFDENFVPAYHEDSDAHARIALAGQKAYVTGGAWFYHFGSQTMRSDPDYIGAPTGHLFMEKWGHGVVSEVDEMRRVYFKTPYNEPDKPLSYWRGEA